MGCGLSLFEPAVSGNRRRVTLGDVLTLQRGFDLPRTRRGTQADIQ